VDTPGAVKDRTAWWSARRFHRLTASRIRSVGCRRLGSELLPPIELENRSAFGCLFRVIDIDLVDVSNEPRAEPRPPRVRGNHAADECSGVLRPQFDRSHFLNAQSNTDGCMTGSPQVAHPVDFAEGADQPSPAGVLAEGDGVVRGRPLFRPRMLMSTSGPIGTPAARRRRAMTLKNGTHAGTRDDVRRSATLGPVPWALMT
jgi:hypothetical protein